MYGDNEPAGSDTLARLHRDTAQELRRIEHRGHALPGDYTRAAILRASLRSYEIEMGC